MNEIATLNPSLSSTALALEPFFAPKGVAVIGASPKPGNQGKRIMDSLIAQGYKGRRVAVHPDGESWDACQSVRSLCEIPQGIDLAISAVSAGQVEALIEPLADQGIHHLIVVSGGFSEIGVEGELLQNKLRDTAKKFAVRIVGPNCLGTFSASDKFNSFFLSPDETLLPAAGPVALISQSGAFLSSILDQLARREVGVHRAINFGNRIDVGECEALEAFAADPAVKVIGVYLESIQNGRRFFELARNITRDKPIVIYKGGKSEKGSRATQAHSASLAGSYSVFKAASEQAGMIEVEGLDELVKALDILLLDRIPQGKRVLIVSNGGGMGVLLTDLCERRGCVIEEPPLQIQQEIKHTLPNYYSLRNPIDLTGSGTNEQCAFAVDKLLSTGLYDCLLLVILSGTEGINAEIASQLYQILPTGFPVVIGAYGEKMVSKLSAAFKMKGVPVFPTGEDAAWAVNFLVRIGTKKLSQKKYSTEVKSIYSSLPLQGWLDHFVAPPDEMQLKQKLSECGVPIPQSSPVAKREDLHNLQIKFPMLLKVIGKDIQHKTELKAIRSDLFRKNELLIAWKEMNQTWRGQVWGEEQMPQGLDLMVGMHRDVDFGPVLLFGTGGKYVEIYKDIERIILPAQGHEILQAIYRTQVGRVIQGFRGEGLLDVQKLLGFIQLIAKWVESEKRLVSLDFNPLRLYADSLVILDAKAEMEPLK
jgi:acetate---CoA ligase (ADP-forming)